MKKHPRSLNRRSAFVCLPLILMVAFFIPTFGQNAREVLNNTKIIELVRLGLSEAVIIAKINQSDCVCDTTTDSIAKLKAAKVPDSIILAMLNSTQSPVGIKSKSTPDQQLKSSSKADGPASTTNITGTSVPEVSIRAEMDKIRTVLIQRFTRQGFQPSQLAFIREAKDWKGQVTGFFFGKDQNNPRQILTFVLTKTPAGVVVLARFSLLYPDDAGQGNRQDVDGKKTRKSLIKELLEIKHEAEQ